MKIICMSFCSTDYYYLIVAYSAKIQNTKIQNTLTKHTHKTEINIQVSKLKTGTKQYKSHLGDNA